MNISELAAPFPGNAISWRAQSVTKQEPYKAMALAYIDARDVMARLDAVCGPENWQDSYAETPSGRMICTISIKIGDEWIGKADGSGDSDIEGEKGGISGAFKRAAVKWGIGRYLYDMPTPWVECEVYNGKWKKWTANGLRELARVGGNADPAPKNDPQPVATITDDQRDIIAGLAEAANITLLVLCETYKIKDLRELPAAKYENVKNRLNATIDSNTVAREKKAA